MRHLRIRAWVATSIILFVSIAAVAEQSAPNYAARSAGATIVGPRNASGSRGEPQVVNDGDVINYGSNHGYAWAYLTTPLVATFPQEKTINKIEMLLLDIDARFYRYKIEVSSDGHDFRTVSDRTKEKCKGWQTNVFTPISCRYIRVTFTDTSVGARSYHVVELAAYKQPDPNQPSLLYEQYLRRRVRFARQKKERATVIDVDELVKAVFDNDNVMDRAKRLDRGRKIELDTDADGDPDIAVWKEKNMVVAALDEDDDMVKGKAAADKDSDCWGVDYRSDGVIDRVVDYIDNDGDGDGDAMVLYLLTSNVWSRSQMTCVVIGDLDDDNEMWHLLNYEYQQGACQWRCDFIGDEFFSMGRYNESAGKWASVWENPFCFYDVDGDGLSEVVLRFEGRDLNIMSVRYSFDVDNDATQKNPKDYDFSITTRGSVEIPSIYETRFPLRGGKTLRYVAWAKGSEAAERAKWTKAILTWDENDNNVNERSRHERLHERWEGVIARGCKYFRQVGGPATSPYNKRFEVDQDYSGNMQLYYSPVDKRFHLLGAELGWLDVDYDNDGKVDMRFRYEDTDKDGFFDKWQTDADGDGSYELAYIAKNDEFQVLALDYEKLNRFYVEVVKAASEENQSLVNAIKTLLGEGAKSKIESYWLNDMGKKYYAAEKVRNSKEGQRYYSDLIREDYFSLLRDRRGSLRISQDDFDGIEELYKSGDCRAVVERLRKVSGVE